MDLWSTNHQSNYLLMVVFQKSHYLYNESVRLITNSRLTMMTLMVRPISVVDSKVLNLQDKPKVMNMLKRMKWETSSVLDPNRSMKRNTMEEYEMISSWISLSIDFERLLFTNTRTIKIFITNCMTRFFFPFLNVYIDTHTTRHSPKEWLVVFFSFSFSSFLFTRTFLFSSTV